MTSAPKQSGRPLGDIDPAGAPARTRETTPGSTPRPETEQL
jgi:hypothetical protein